MDNFFRKVLILFSRILHIKMKEKTAASLIQFMKFCIVGLSNTAVGYVLYVAVILVLKPYEVSWDYYAGNLVGFVLSVLWSFYWNNRFIFKQRDGEKRNLVQALLRAYLSYAFVGLVLNNAFSYLWIEVLGIPKMIAPFFNVVIGAPINFIMNKVWTFKDLS